MLNLKAIALAGVLFSAIMVASCGGGSSSGGSNTAAAEAEVVAETEVGTDSTTEGIVASKIFLDAFNDFSCSSGWTNRHGGLGRAPYSGSGTCKASFPGESGRYAVSLQAQTEFDGSSPYAVSINGSNILEGRYPYAQGELICDCPEPWREHCPDRRVTLDAGVREINTGDTIGFFGDDVYPCGDDSHGAYAIWRGMTFIRQ
jgi:hypothetical protein